jgi:hypothetical protein
MPQWTITRIVEEVGADEKGMVANYIRVDFKVGEDGPFTHRFSKKEFKSQLVRQHLEEFARDLATLRA